MNKSFKNAVDNRLSNITAPNNLSDKIILIANCTKKTTAFPLKRIISIAATFCLALTLSIGVMAASVPELSNLFAIIGDNIASLTTPIIQTSESNGIRMQVLSALNDDDAVVIYLTLQDITSSRIDETLELYNLEITGIHFPHSEVIHYDDISKIATVRISGMGGEELRGKKITVTLPRILNSKTVSDFAYSGLTVADIKKLNPNAQIHYPKNINEWECRFDTSVMPEEVMQKMDAETMPILMPEQNQLALPQIGWSYLSGFGVIDNVLHLQQNPNNYQGRYNSLSFVLADENDKLLADLPKSTVSFGEKEQEGIYRYSDYIEDAILLPLHSVHDSLKIYYSYTNFAEIIEGNWKTTFNLQKVTEQKTANCIINMNPWEITSVSVSPIGVTLYGSGQMYDYSISPNIIIKRIDGTVVECNRSNTSFENSVDGIEKIVIKQAFTLPMKLSEIASVSINEIDIPLK